MLILVGRQSVLIVATMMVLLAGCSSGSGEGLDQNGRPIGETPPSDPPPTEPPPAEPPPDELMATLESIQSNVFTPTCAIPGCHLGGSAPLGLRLEEGSSFALLVGIPSAEVPDLLRVAAGDPDNSYLIRKLEGTASVGGRMPLNGPPFLDQPTIDVIRQWVAEGAMPGITAAQSPQVVATLPGFDGALGDMPDELIVIFSENMDESLMSGTTIQLRQGGTADATSAATNVGVTAAALRLADANRRMLKIDLSALAMKPGDFELRLLGSGPTGLASEQGILLDGDADGVAGGDFMARFVIEERRAGTIR